MGGDATDKQGMSSIKGLWVSGEASSTGLHGANRLASNGLLEALVYAATAADGMIQAINDDQACPFVDDLQVPELGFKYVDEDAVLELRKIMSDKVGVMRDGDGLAQALRELKRLSAQNNGTSTNFENMLAAATLITAAAYNRRESRGGHFRTDYPDKDDQQKHRTEITYTQAIAIRDSV
jgi:L-aspartate oxidase